MKRIGIVPIAQGSGAGLITAMLATELAAESAVSGKYEGITAVELGRGNLYDQLCADRWFRVRQMVSYWNCIHSGGQAERITNPRCGVNWLLRTPEDKIGLDDGAAGSARNLERDKAVKLLYSLPGDVALVDFSSVAERDMFYLLEDMEQIVVVADPLPSKLLQGYELLYRLKLWKKPACWVVNRWNDGVDKKELRKVLGSERGWIPLPEIPRALLCQAEYGGCGIAEHQQIRGLLSPGLNQIIRRLGLAK